MSRLSINLWGQEGCNGAICSTRIQASSDDHQEARSDEHPKDFSEFLLVFPGCFAPLAGHLRFFFKYVGYKKSRKFVLQVENPFEKNIHFDLGGCWSIERAPGSRLKSWLDSGEQMCRSDAWKGGYSIYKSGALQRCFLWKLYDVTIVIVRWCIYILFEGRIQPYWIFQGWNNPWENPSYQQDIPVPTGWVNTFQDVSPGFWWQKRHTPDLRPLATHQTVGPWKIPFGILKGCFPSKGDWRWL